MTVEEILGEFNKQIEIIPVKRATRYKRIRLEPKKNKQYFFVVGFNGEELKYFHLGDDNSCYTGFREKVTDATILDDGLYECLKECVFEAAKSEQLCILAKMPIKIGE